MERQEMTGPYRGEVSKRLWDFIEDHAEYWDSGNAESGPMIESAYNGPEWAMWVAEWTWSPELSDQSISGCNYWMTGWAWTEEDLREYPF